MKSNTEKINFVKSIFGSVKVARDGVNVAVMCPSCNEKKGKFSINVSNWMCHCWICGVKSKNLYFILKKNRSREISQKFLSNFGLPKEIKKEILDFPEKIEIPDRFILLANYSGKDPDIREVIAYCKSRGLTKKDLWYFRIGASGESKFRRRVIIPSFDASGDLNYFVSRAIDKDGFPKYSNSRAKKTEIIFNELNIDWRKEVTIVEGPFDLIKAGYNATCLLGSKLSKSSKLFGKIVENKTPVMLALDKDMEVESHNISKLLTSYGVNVRVFKNTSSTDVGGMTKDQFKNMSKNAELWSQESSLKFKISSIKSGSIF